VLLTEKYNIAQNSWSTLSSMSSMPISHYRGCSAFIGDQVFFFGSLNRNWSSTGVNATVNVTSFTMSNGAWKILGIQMPVGRWNAVAVSVDNNIFIIGGFNASGVITERMDVLDTQQMTWRRGSDYIPTDSMTATNMNGLIPVLGGTGAILNGANVLNPRVNLFKTNVLNCLNIGRDSFGAAFVNGVLYAFGGRTIVGGVSTFYFTLSSSVKRT